MSLLAWVLVTFSGFAEGGMQAVMKLAPLHRFAVLAAGFLLAVPYYAVWVAWEGMGAVHPLFWPLVALHVLCMVIGFTLLVEGLQSSPLTKVAPYLSFTPFWLLFTAPFVASITGTGWPTILGTMGALVMVCGLYVHNIRDTRTGFLAPFRELMADRGSRLVFWAAAVFAITATLDPFILQYASIPFYFLVDHGLGGLAFAGMGVAWYATNRIKREELMPGRCWGLLILLGFAIAASAVLHMFALRLGVPVSYVVAVKRSWALLSMMGIGLALAVAFRASGRHAAEAEAFTWRLPGVLLMLAGMVIILLWGKSP